mmetsp:Transcript_20166/g.42221  ORF Transcript_20166/g.42221 Transcript_20166/m.42221 type:complete len:201 (-) Transcript_20166:859-1461(-)
MNDGFPVLVSIIGGSIAGIDFNRQGGGQIIGINKGFIFPGQFVSGNLQISDTIGTNPRHGVSTSSRGHDIAQSTSGTRFGTGKGRDARWKVVGFGGQNRMQGLGANLHRSSLIQGSGTEGLDIVVSTNGGGIVVKGNNGIFLDLIGLECGLDHLKQGFGLFDAINDHFTTKKPMTRMFGIGLSHIKAFHISRIASQFFLE